MSEVADLSEVKNISPIEVWGGIECSVVRVSNDWRDQVCETGHHARGVADIDLLAELGLKTLRYPFLWERNNQDGAEKWRWQDRQFQYLQKHNISVVAGLVHHGSGPAGTDLLDPGFPEKLATYAGLTASRYPSVRSWTPVNEPLTTARFSCLYGHWYPHVRNEGQFLRAVVNQCRAILLAMAAIRAKIPNAHFVHTEDIGRIFSTAPMSDQAAYENTRRWLSLDLLCGLVDRHHPWRDIIEAHGIPIRDLDELATGYATPDLIGVNHYVTSDRYLDHRVNLYPPQLRGGNGRIVYADTEAARVDIGPNLTGWEPRLREVWERYRRPMAITEVHLGCEDALESVRWLMEAWNAAHSLRAEGIPIQAITPWGLFGLVDWNTMLCERRGHYEVGALNPYHNPPIRTILTDAITSLAQNGHFTHPGLSEPGWWRRNDRAQPIYKAR